jgi:uncharacterized protein with NAD-binding domain and iron-sulfur cluster
MTRVVVLGGGIAGLTAAHELLVRGFEVEIYESAPELGGLAKTQWHEQVLDGEKLRLPGEHGFRLFPSFYRHVGDSMRRTPDAKDSDRNILERLIATRTQGIAFEGDKLQSIRFERTMPRSSESISRGIMRSLNQMRLEPNDMYRFQMKMVQYMTSCSERRLAEYEKISWWEFLDGDQYSERFQRYLNSVPRALVAMDAKRSDGRTQSNILLQHMMDHLSAGATVDRVLDGPTSDRWIDPWGRYLGELGAKFFFEHAAQEIVTDRKGNIQGVKISHGGEVKLLEADYFVAALPLRVLRRLLTRAHAEEDAIRCTHGNPAIFRLLDYPLERALALLSGIQYYLEHDVSIIPGHVFLPDSAWGLSIVSQAQFWGDNFRQRWGAGKFGGIISVDIANFDEPFEIELPDGQKETLTARSCTEEQLALGVWQQIHRSFDAPEEAQRAVMEVYDNDHLEYREWRLPLKLPPFHVDSLLKLPNAGVDAEVLINPPGSHELRAGPAGSYAVHLGKLVFAGTYMQTFTGLPTMEAANESARHATNAILEIMDHAAERCVIWPVEGAEPRDLDGLKDLDRELFSRGQKHFMEILGIESLLMSMMPRGDSLAEGELSTLIDRYFPGAKAAAEKKQIGRTRRSRPPDPLSDQLAALGQLFRMGVR